jgi:hypothetical protein
MGGLQYGEGPTKFALKSVDRFGSYYTRDLLKVSFWATSISYTPFLDNFDDILASMLLERDNV